MKIHNYLAGVAVVAGLSACHHPEAQKADNGPVCVNDSLAKLITIDVAKSSKVAAELNLSGEIASDDNNVIKVFPFSSGQVTEVKVSLGDHVNKGQTLAVLRSADVAGNYTDLSSTQSDVSVAKRQLDQAEYLYKNGISSEREYTEAKENYNKAAAANRKVRDQIAINGGGNTSASGSLVIKAPESGYIIEKNITSGSFIRPDNAGSMFTIGNMQTVWVWANVFESDISKIKVGDQAAITTVAYPDKTFPGKVDQISSVLDPDNKVMKVRIVLPNPGLLLKPEMFASVKISSSAASPATSLPSKTILFDNKRQFVVLYNDKCNLAVREVKVLKTVGDTTWLASGLNVGDRVVSSNQLLLYNALISR